MGGKNTALHKNNAPSLKSSTLYVDTKASKGFYVHKDVKSVLIQKNNGSKTTTYGSGTSDLESILKSLNYVGADDTGSYLFKISAILTDGRATVVIIHDWNETDAKKGEDTPDIDSGEHSKATVNANTLVISGVEYTDGDFKTPIGNALASKGFSVTGWNASGTNPAANSTLTAVKDGTVYTFTFSGTPAAYTTIYVDGDKGTVPATQQYKDVIGGDAHNFIYYKVTEADGDVKFVKNNDTNAVATGDKINKTDKYVKVSVTPAVTGGTALAGKLADTKTLAITGAALVESTVTKVGTSDYYAKIGDVIRATVDVVSSKADPATTDTITAAVTVAAANGGATQATVTLESGASALLAVNDTVAAGNATATKKTISFKLALPADVTDLGADTAITFTVS